MIMDTPLNTSWCKDIIAYKGYNDKRDIVSYWHTYDKKEVDAVFGDAKVAIEIKSTEHVENKHKKGLKAFKEEHPDCRMILVSLDPITRKSGEEELVYVIDFLKMLWNGEIFWFFFVTRYGCVCGRIKPWSIVWNANLPDVGLSPPRQPLKYQNE